MTKTQRAPGQMTLLHLCCTCNVLVPFEQALAIAPDSPGANHPLHRACVEADKRWAATFMEWYESVEGTDKAVQA